MSDQSYKVQGILVNADIINMEVEYVKAFYTGILGGRRLVCWKAEGSPRRI